MLQRQDGDHAAVVTGGARGIGLAVASALASERIPVACADQPSADFEPFIAVCEGTGVKHLELRVDVRDQVPVRDAIKGAAALGTVRYAVNCAGVDGPAVSATVAADDWHRVMDIDLDGVLYACQAEYALMRAAGGSIVNIASMSGSIINRGAPHASYSAAKAAVIHLSKALGVEWPATASESTPSVPATPSRR